jgi:hypothetical protein
MRSTSELTLLEGGFKCRKGERREEKSVRRSGDDTKQKKWGVKSLEKTAIKLLTLGLYNMDQPT